MQVPATWHWSEALHTTPTQLSTPAQVPPVQMSPTVLALPSLQDVPLLAVGLEQAPVV